MKFRDLSALMIACLEMVNLDPALTSADKDVVLWQHSQEFIDDHNIIRDLCRKLALGLQSNGRSVKSKFDSASDGVFSRYRTRNKELRELAYKQSRRSF